MLQKCYGVLASNSIAPGALTWDDTPMINIVNAVQETLNIGCRTSRKPESSNARLNLAVVQVHVSFHFGRTLSGLNVREVHRLRVLLQGHRAIDSQALIQRVKASSASGRTPHFVRLLVVVVGQLGETCLPSIRSGHANPDQRRIDVSLLHVERHRTKGECATLVSRSTIESVWRSGRVVKCGGLENVSEGIGLNVVNRLRRYWSGQSGMIRAGSARNWATNSA
jgi:hypothetical protein